MAEPSIVPGLPARLANQGPTALTGQSFGIYEWTGSGPDYLHVHYADDEAWYILEGTLTFRFLDKQVPASAGTTVFVPAGVPHTYFESNGPARYLVIMTPRLYDLIEALHHTPREEHQAVMRRFESEILE